LTIRHTHRAACHLRDSRGAKGSSNFSADQAHFLCELRTYEGCGVEALFWVDGGLLTAKRFDTRAPAVQWATIERDNFEKGGE
jgi:hypothetical protein